MVNANGVTIQELTTSNLCLRIKVNIPDTELINQENGTPTNDHSQGAPDTQVVGGSDAGGTGWLALEPTGVP